MEKIVYSADGVVKSIDATFGDGKDIVVNYVCDRKGDLIYSVSVHAKFDSINEGYLQFCIIIDGSDFKMTEFCCSLSYSLGIGNEGPDVLDQFRLLFEASDGLFEEKLAYTITKFFEDF